MDVQCDQIGLYCTLGHFLKPLATINLPKSPTFLSNFCKGVKIIFLVKSFLGNFYRHLAIFIWSHWMGCSFSFLCLFFLILIFGGIFCCLNKKYILSKAFSIIKNCPLKNITIFVGKELVTCTAKPFLIKI